MPPAVLVERDGSGVVMRGRAIGARRIGVDIVTPHDASKIGASRVQNADGAKGQRAFAKALLKHAAGRLSGSILAKTIGAHVLHCTKGFFICFFGRPHCELAIGTKGAVA